MKKSLILLMLTFLFGCTGTKPAIITIQPNENKMEYRTTEFKVKSNQEVTIIMDNIATMPAMKHNVVILADSSKITEVGTQALSAPGYLPDHSAIIAATPMADAGQKTQITFKAPSKPGKYTYICTYPGHYALMEGVMIVE